MDKVRCDIPLNDTEKKTEASARATLGSRREFLACGCGIQRCRDPCPA